MDNNGILFSITSSETPQSRPKNGTSVLPFSANCTLKLESKNVEQLHEIVFNAESLENIRTLELTKTELQNLPNSFTLNLGNLIHLNLEENKFTSLPPYMKKLKRLQHFNISNNCLKSLPEDIGMLDELRDLNLANNNLTVLPDDICELKKLVHLIIADNNLKTLPDDVGNLQNIEKLDISGNVLEDLPESMGRLNNLVHLSAASNKLSSLPEGFTHFNKLTVLNLSYNSLYDVPYCLFIGLPNISLLDLSHNYIDDFSKAPTCVSKLRILNISHNTMFCMPRWIFQDTCRQLLELNLSHNRYMNGISNDVFISESSLKSVDISDCNLTTTSVNFLSGLHNLESLNIGNKMDPNNKQSSEYGNVFWDLPVKEMSNTVKIRELTMCGVGLAGLQEDIVKMSALQYIDLRSNELNWLPDAFCDLINLKTCLLSNNGLALLPSQIGKLIALKELILDGNKLHTLPETVAELVQLEYLDLYDNNFEEVPTAIKNLTNLKGLDLEYNCFETSESVEYVDTYPLMKCSIRKRLTGNSQFRKDSKKQSTDNDNLYSSADEATSSLYGEDNEKESFCDGKFENNEDYEENWDNEDEFNDSFDPTLLPPSPHRKQRIRRALLVEESLISSPDNFCPADIHVPSIKLWNRTKRITSNPLPVVEGQFDDSSIG